MFYQNGEYKNEAEIPLNDRGFRYGDGVFDTLVMGCHMDLHFARLERHAQVFGIKMPISRDEWLIAAQKIAKSGDVLNTYVTRGGAVRGLAITGDEKPSIIMASSQMPPKKDFKAIVAKSVRRNEFSPLSQIKSMCYGDNILALNEAQEQGANEAILLNTKGYVACATVGNVIVEIDGARYTPPLSDGAIDGVTRGIEIKEGRLKEKSLSEDDLKNDIYICNSVRGIVKIEMVW